MRVLVTGATGFIGQNVIKAVQRLGGCNVIASGRREAELRSLGCEYVVYDLDQQDPNCYERLGCPEVMIHLAWEPLWDYHSLRHLEHTLVTHYRFIKTMIASGVQVVSCTGTCYEYGLQDGQLSEDLPTQPTTPYGVAKDMLRRFLECFRDEHEFRLRWLRLFFTFGTGQHARALIPQLDKAIDSGAQTFAMSGGEQLRDYLPIDRVAEYIVKTTLQLELDGIINICQGTPQSIWSLVQNRMRERGRVLDLQRGHYPYRSYEPLAFWGDNRRLRRALAAYDQGRHLLAERQDSSPSSPTLAWRQSA